MIIAYKDKYEENLLMNNTYWETSSKNNLKSQNTPNLTVTKDTVFSKKFYSIDPKESTTAIHIHDVSKKYLNPILERIHKKVDHTSRVKPAFTQGTVLKLIDKDNPVILFGYVPNDPNKPSGSKSTHAVVAYGYTSDKKKLIVHYGWESNSYRNAYIDLSYFQLGSIYTFDLK